MPPRKPEKRFRGLAPYACDSAISPVFPSPVWVMGALLDGWRNDDALRMADEFLSRSRALSDPVLLMVAHRVMGSTLLTVGDFQSSANHFEETIRLSTSEGRRLLYNLYMVEPQAASLLLLSWDLWFLGYPDQSLSRVSEALALGQDLGHPYTVAFAHYMTSVVHLLRGDAARALESTRKKLRDVTRTAVFAIRDFIENFARAGNRRPGAA